MIIYAGAEIEKREDGFYITHDNGEEGPFKTYDVAADIINI